MSARKNETNRRAYYRARYRVFDMLGGRCACGEEDVRVMQVDHVHGGGNVDRKRSGWVVHRVVQREAAAYGREYVIAKYATKCASCHMRETAKDNTAINAVLKEREAEG